MITRSGIKSALKEFIKSRFIFVMFQNGNFIVMIRFFFFLVIYVF